MRVALIPTGEHHGSLVGDVVSIGVFQIQSTSAVQDETQGLKVVFQDRNQGKGAALRRGFEEVGGDIVIIQDADFEYDPADYGTLLQPILDGKADVVYGSRFLGGPHRVLFFWHYIGNLLLTLLSNALNNINLTDMETCYKVFRKEVLASLDLKSNRFGFEPEFTAKVAKRRFRIYEVGISYSGRTYAEGKKIGWRDFLISSASKNFLPFFARFILRTFLDGFLNWDPNRIEVIISPES